MSLLDFDEKEPEIKKLKQFNTTDFELKTLFSIINSLKPKKTRIDIDETPRVITKDFNPTLKGPDIKLTDSKEKDYSIWHNPIIYLPYDKKTEAVVVDFIFIQEDTDSLYNLSNVEKMLKTHDYLTDEMMRDLSIRLLASQKEIQLLFFVRKNFTQQEIKEIKNISFYLKPKRVLIASEEYLDDKIKMDLPLNVDFVENVDVNFEKLRNKISNLL